MILAPIGIRIASPHAGLHRTDTPARLHPGTSETSSAVTRHGLEPQPLLPPCPAAHAPQRPVPPARPPPYRLLAHPRTACSPTPVSACTLPAQTDLLGVSACLDRLSRLEQLLTALTRATPAPPSPARAPADPHTLPSLPDASTTDNVATTTTTTNANATAGNAQGVSVPLGRSGAHARGSTGSLPQLAPLSLQLPLPTPGSLLDEVIVEPGGRVVSKQQQQQQQQQVVTPTGRVPGAQAAGAGTEAGGSEGQGQVAQAGALCGELRRELTAGGRRCGEAMELLMQVGRREGGRDRGGHGVWKEGGHCWPFGTHTCAGDEPHAMPTHPAGSGTRLT